jgi:hypothetical protein
LVMAGTYLANGQSAAGAAAREISAAWRGSEDVFAHPYAAAFLTAL